MRRLFDLDADVELIGEHLSRDARLADCVAKRPGLRVPGAWDGFETAVRAILGQQITVVAARKLAGKMVERFGEPLPKQFARSMMMTRFPRPVVLNIPGGADIASLGMPKARARAIASLAASVISEPDLLSPVGDLDECVRRLKSLPGIGEWTAQYIAMRVLQEPDAFHASDVGLLRAMPNGESRPTPGELLATAETWRPWRAYAAQHLWMSDSDA